MKLNWKNDEELKKLAEKIEAKSPYKKIENPNKKWMTVAQMGKMLGLKKTDRYWLIHKNYFRTETLMGKMRVDVESFEKWYANQVKYHKIGGEAPGKELKERSLSARDIEEILECGSWTAYEIMNKFKDDIIIVDYWKRLPAEVFWKWYEGQTRYRTKEDRDRDKEIEAATMSMPEMARALGVTRSKIYGILRNPKYAEYFELVIVADRKRYTKEGFEKFLASQDEYKRPVKKKTKKVEKDSDQKPVQEDSFTKVRETVKLDSSSVLTLDQAAAMAGVAKATVSKWCSKRYFPNVKQGKVVRIPAETYKEWLRIYRDWEG